MITRKRKKQYDDYFSDLASKRLMTTCTAPLPAPGTRASYEYHLGIIEGVRSVRLDDSTTGTVNIVIGVGLFISYRKLYLLIVEMLNTLECIKVMGVLHSYQIDRWWFRWLK